MKKQRSTATNESQPASPSTPRATPRPARRVYRLTYANNQPREEPKLYRCRDGIAFNEINAALSDEPDPKYSYEMTINLYPDDRRKLTDGYPRFDPSDLIVLTMRPPLNDRRKNGARRFIQRNHGPLEKEILDVVCRKYFTYCSRRFVKLTKQAMALLGPDVDPNRWRKLEFFENHQTDRKIDLSGRPNQRRHWAAVIKKHHVSPDQQVPPEPEHTSTVAYLIRDRLPAIGCDVLVSFGMDGYCTLIWNHIVRRQHPEWTRKKGFVMAELVFNELQDTDTRPPITIAFADKIVQVNLLAEAGPIA